MYIPRRIAWSSYATYFTAGIIATSTLLFLLPPNLVINWNQEYSRITSMLVTSAVNFSGIDKYLQLSRDYATLIGLLGLFIGINWNENQKRIKTRSLLYVSVSLIVPILWSFFGRENSVGLSTIEFASFGAIVALSVESLSKLSLIVLLGASFAILFLPTQFFYIGYSNVDFTSHLVCFGNALLLTLVSNRILRL